MADFKVAVAIKQLLTPSMTSLRPSNLDYLQLDQLIFLVVIFIHDQLPRRVSEKDVKETTANIAFGLFDLDRDGFITKDEFKQVTWIKRPCQGPWFSSIGDVPAMIFICWHFEMTGQLSQSTWLYLLWIMVWSNFWGKTTRHPATKSDKKILV